MDAAYRKDRRGFTLIDLLAVVAIISILASVLFPVFAKAREKARQTTCLSNEKQIGLAFLQYSQDYDERLPCGLRVSPKYFGDTMGIGWASEIYSYVESTGVFKCPDDSTQTAAAALLGGIGTTTVHPISYAANTNALYIVGTANNGLKIPTGTAVFTFNAPAKTLMLAEISGDQVNLTDSQEFNSPRHFSTTDGDFVWSWTYAAPSPVNTSLTMEYGKLTNATNTATTNTGGVDAGNPQGRHTNGANYLLADGHAKWSVPGQVCAGVTAPTAASAAGAFTANQTNAPSAEGTGNNAHALTFSLV